MHDERDSSRLDRGEPIPVDEHFDRRLTALLDDAEHSGDYVDTTAEDFDAMEREAEELVRKRNASH